MLKRYTKLTLAVLMTLGTGACTAAQQSSVSPENTAVFAGEDTDKSHETESDFTETEETAASDMFTERDLEQTADVTDAQQISLQDGQTVTIDSEGVYVIKGNAENACIVVDAADTDKVQLVLDGVTAVNEDQPVIYVKNADKVFVMTTDSVNELTVSSDFAEDENNADAVIFSKDDLVISGTGTLKIGSSGNGITSKDDLKVTGGTIEITCKEDALEANDSIRIADGTITINTEKDGLHAENDDDDSTGYIFIEGGSLTITAGDDAIHGTTEVTVAGGTLDLSGRECIEATVIVINDGVIGISASDDGINAGKKSSQYSPSVTISGGVITIEMGQGDTDAIDSNGDLTISGGSLNITAQSPFDYDGNAVYSGGTMIINGQETTEITNQFGGMGFMGGNQMPDSETGSTPEGTQPEQGGGFFGRGYMSTPEDGGNTHSGS